MIAAPDYELVTTRVGLVDRFDRGKLLLQGSEAAEFLQGQITNDVEALGPGEGCYAALLTHKGKIRADLRVLRSEDWIWLDTEALGRAAVVRTVQTYSLGRDVRFQDVTDARAILSLIGPAARDVLDAPPPASEHAWVEGEHGIHVATDLGVDVICTADEADAVRAALGVEAVDEAVAECVRIESGRPRHGRELTDDVIPQEAGLNDRAVDFTKGCYVGQETVARLYYKGSPYRHLRGLRLAAPAAPGEPVALDGRAVGQVGSACVSPVHGPIALALLRREAAPGDTVAVGAEGRPAEVVELPFPAGG